jgi:hypothetical protein
MRARVISFGVAVDVMTSSQLTIRSTVILKVTLSTAVANIRQITDVAKDNCCISDEISLEIIKAL